MTRRDVFEAQQVVYLRWFRLEGHQRAVSKALEFDDRIHISLAQHGAAEYRMFVPRAAELLGG